ncbi:MAG TPA: Gfo/Idh/MocA family oxidoreductase [Candidatus Hydrogenedentes bacterium]|nr:Gfo/Idh/MocA family oxidoreductase [Candidatus Hydrogenedentota bacterium]
MKQLTRRRFLNQAAGALALPNIVSAPLRGANAPANRIALGFIGLGSHGVAANLHNMMGQSDTQVVALCDVDQERVAGAQEIVTRHYAEAQRSGAWRACATTRDWRELVARDDLDAIVVSTPDHWHVPIALAAVRSGRDVYCEKPLTLTVAEGRVLSDAVRRYARVFQTGSEFRAQANLLQAAELVRNGRLGKLHTIVVYLPGGPDENVLEWQPTPVPKGFDYDMWLGPAPWAPYHPKRCHYQFRWILDYSGGQLTDWGGHLVDQAQWANDTEYTGPIRVEGEGVFPPRGLYDVATDFRVTYTYRNGVTLICTSQPRDLAGSIRFEGSQGWVLATYGQGIKAEPAVLLDERFGPDDVRLYTCRSGPERNFLDCVKTRRDPYYPAEVGHRSVTICHLGNIAMRLRRKLRWNPDEERFVDDAEANRMLGRVMRSPWHL